MEAARSTPRTRNHYRRHSWPVTSQLLENTHFENDSVNFLLPILTNETEEGEHIPTGETTSDICAVRPAIHVKDKYDLFEHCVRERWTAFAGVSEKESDFWSTSSDDDSLYGNDDWLSEVTRKTGMGSRCGEVWNNLFTILESHDET